MQSWIGVDLDGTLAYYAGFRGPAVIGGPVMPMVRRVRDWLAGGIDVRIFTARVWTDGSPERTAEAKAAEEAIRKWCTEHLGRELPITCCKDPGMVGLWDDRCVQVLRNTGEPAV